MPKKKTPMRHALADDGGFLVYVPDYFLGPGLPAYYEIHTVELAPHGDLLGQVQPVIYHIGTVPGSAKLDPNKDWEPCDLKGNVKSTVEEVEDPGFEADTEPAPEDKEPPSAE